MNKNERWLIKSNLFFNRSMYLSRNFLTKLMQFIQSDTNEFTDVRFSKYIFLHSYNQLSYRFFSQRRLLLVTSSGIERFLPFRRIDQKEGQRDLQLANAKLRIERSSRLGLNRRSWRRLRISALLGQFVSS